MFGEGLAAKISKCHVKVLLRLNCISKQSLETIVDTVSIKLEQKAFQ